MPLVPSRSIGGSGTEGPLGIPRSPSSGADDAQPANGFADSRAAQNHFLKKDFIRPSIIDNIRKLNEIAEKRGQTLAQMAIAWVLRGGHITSALIGASRSSQIVDCVAALRNDTFTAEELAEIDVYAKEADINLWASSAERA